MLKPAAGKSSLLDEEVANCIHFSMSCQNFYPDWSNQQLELLYLQGRQLDLKSLIIFIIFIRILRLFKACFCIIYSNRNTILKVAHEAGQGILDSTGIETFAKKT